MSKGVYPRTQEWKNKIEDTLSATHSVVVTGSPRTGILMPYIGHVFPTQRALARVVGVSPHTIQYWLSRGYIGVIYVEKLD